MPWITPVTDRGRTAYCTYEDLNRICGNINYLSGTSLSTSFSTSDYLTKTTFQAIVNACIEMCNKYGIKYTTKPSLDTTWTNFNNIEKLTQLCYERLQLWNIQVTTNTGVSNQYDRYAGVPEGYSVRGGGR